MELLPCNPNPIQKSCLLTVGGPRKKRFRGGEDSTPKKPVGNLRAVPPKKRKKSFSLRGNRSDNNSARNRNSIPARSQAVPRSPLLKGSNSGGSSRRSRTPSYPPLQPRPCPSSLPPLEGRFEEEIRAEPATLRKEEKEEEEEEEEENDDDSDCDDDRRGKKRRTDDEISPMIESPFEPLIESLLSHPLNRGPKWTHPQPGLPIDSKSASNLQESEV